MGNGKKNFQSSVFNLQNQGIGGRNSPAETKCARAVGIGLPERSEPEGPQGAARAQSLLEPEKKGLDWIDRLN